jgi:hypothetical protein
MYTASTGPLNICLSVHDPSPKYAATACATCRFRVHIEVSFGPVTCPEPGRKAPCGIASADHTPRPHFRHPGPYSPTILRHICIL